MQRHRFPLKSLSQLVNTITIHVFHYFFLLGLIYHLNTIFIFLLPPPRNASFCISFIIMFSHEKREESYLRVKLRRSRLYTKSLRLKITFAVPFHGIPSSFAWRNQKFDSSYTQKRHQASSSRLIHFFFVNFHFWRFSLSAFCKGINFLVFQMKAFLGIADIIHAKVPFCSETKES